MLGGDLEAAREALLEAQKTGGEADGLWRYVHALTLEQEGQLAEASAALRQLEDKLPSGAYAKKARFARARALGKLGQHGEAAAILGDAARELGSTARKDELAGGLAELADHMLADEGVPLVEQNLARQRAVAVLQEALGLAPSGLVALKLHERLVDLALPLDQPALAAEELSQMIALAPSLPEGALSPLELDTLRLKLAEAKLSLAGGRGDSADLDEAIELFRRFPHDALTGDPALLAAAERLVGRALVARGKVEDRLDAEELFTHYLDTRPDAAERVAVAVDLAHLTASMGRDASAAWRRVLTTQPALPEEAEAAAELIRSAWASLGKSLRRAEHFREASDTFRTYVARYPDGPEWSACQAAIVEIELAIASNLERDQEFAAARDAWRSYLDAHPLSAEAVTVARSIADSYADQADLMEDPSAAEPLFRTSIEELERLVQKNPGSDAASSALVRIGSLYETRLGDLDRAIEAWSRCTFGHSQIEAKHALARLQERSLSLRSPRVERTNEPATVELVTRNLQSVEVEIYRLDLESYFRRHHSYMGIEDLDLDLIQADHVFTHQIEAPAPHSLVSEELAMPSGVVSGPGTWVISVLSDTERATTLLSISDLDVILETHGDDAVVFAEDMLSGEPADGVSLLLMQAGETQLGQTDASGLAHFDLASGTQGLSLFATRDGHAASVGLPKVALGRRAHGSAGFIYTDRGVYRAGETVHWKAILRSRSTSGDLYFKVGREFDVDISTPGGVSLFSGVMQLGPYGTLFGDVPLPESAPTGSYTINIQDGARHQVGHFEVREFAVPKTRLTVAALRPLVLPGETQVLTLTARYAHGAPLSGGRISGYIEGDDRLEYDGLVTNEDGEVKLELSRADLERLGDREVQSYAFILDGDAQATGQFFRAGRELSLDLKAKRSLYLAGESFGVDISAHDVFGNATSREALLSVIKLETNRQGARYEHTLETHEVQTGADGHGRVELSLEGGGQYRLRLAGQDALGQPVTAELELEVAPKDDAVELRFLADTTRFEVGDEVALRLHNNGPAGPALVTRLGRGILHHEVVQLVRGDNTLRFTASPAEAPGAAVRVSRMHALKLHTASQRIEVTRDLEVRVMTPKETFKPGELAEVELFVTDKQGRPVQTELSLGLVDAAFYDLFPERYTDLAQSFPLANRLGTLGPVKSSTSFVYSAPSRPISDALLEEQARQERRDAFADRAKEAREFLAKSTGAYRGPGDSTPPAEKRLAPASPGVNDVIGIGGGAGGKFGGRRGGRRHLQASGGLARALDPALDSPTRFWAPAVVTDEAGHAALRMQLPSDGGRWRFTARAVDATSRVGEETREVLTSANFLVQLDAPSSLIGGDQLSPEARVFWRGEGPATADLVFTSQTQGEAAEATRYQVEFDGPGTRTLKLQGVEARNARGVLLLDLAATLDPGGDDPLPPGEDTARDTRRITVAPFGLEVEAKAGGLFTGHLERELALPTSQASARRLDLYVGAGIGAELVEAALGGTTLAPLKRPGPASTLDLAGDLFGASRVLEALIDAGPGSAGQAQLLLGRLRSLAAELALRQLPSGGFSAYPNWSGTITRTAPESTEVSAMALFALSRAARNIEVSDLAIQSATDFLSNQLATLTGDDEARAMAQFALLAVGSSGADQLAGLWRNKSRLSPAAKAYLALAFDLAGRKEQAATLGRELEPLLAGQDGFGPHPCGIWNRDPRSQTGLFLWAMTRVLPDSRAIKPAAEALLASAPWSRGRVRGPALMGLFEWSQGALTQDAGLRAKVALHGPDGNVERELRVPRGRAGSSLTFDIPDAWGPGPVGFRIELESDGRRPSDGWRPTWHARLSGFTDQFAKLTKSPQPVTMSIEAVPPLFDHEPLMTGFSILAQPTETWSNPVAHLHKGERALVKVNPWSFLHAASSTQTPRDTLADETAFLELRVPIPAGTVLVPGSVNAYASNWSPVPGGLAFQLGTRMTSVSFQIMGAAEGHFQTPPATVQSALDPAQFGVSQPMALTILAADKESPDPYRPTPDEVFDRGLKSAALGLDDTAWELLAPLFEEYGQELRPDSRLKLASVLLHQAIVHEDDSSTVRFFELLGSLDPDQILSLDEVMAIGKSYVSLGEDEQAATLFAATLDQRFRQDMGIVGVLDRFAGFSASTTLQEQLWHAYPDSAQVVETRLALTDALLTHAPLAYGDRELAAAGRDAVSLTLEAILFLREFLLIYPTSELASLAGGNLLQAYTSLEDYPRAAAFAGHLADRFKEPRVRDDFRYTRAISLWYMGREAAALKLLDQIAKAEYPSGRQTAPSPNRELALYLMGQIHHAQGDLDAADALYQEVAGDFEDARELDALLQESALFIDEVASVHPGETAKLGVSSKGISEVELQVFPVDLLALYLREGDLDDVAGVSLAGITPLLRRTHQLDARLAMRPVQTQIPLEPFEPGAYLVILRGGELFATGLVVVSDLDLFVQEDPATGGVRCQVTRDSAPVEGVDVRVVGSADPSHFFAGETDRRGLFKTSGVSGEATVIARTDRLSYAFFRGEVALLGGARDKRTPDESSWFLGQGGSSEEVDWLQNVSTSNSLEIQGRAQKQADLRQRASGGIQLKDVR